MRLQYKITLVLLIFLTLLGFLCAYLVAKPIPERITYGMTFSTLYAKELGLDWRETYGAMLDELGVRHLRLAAYWSEVEPENDAYTWSDTDYLIAQAKRRNADVILAIGRRLPRWPECHIPAWARERSWEDQKNEIRDYITETVNRYKAKPSIIYWQVENEPFLEVFANDHCGDLDEGFLKEEIELVRSLDGTRPILVTDSGNLGMWRGAYRAGDVFGTSAYVYFWNPELGQFRTILPPSVYRLKEGVMRLFYGRKPAFLIELSLEPWLIEPLGNVPLDRQFERMDAAKFDEIVEYARETRFDRQYLWGAEWWYWLKAKGRPELWEKGKGLFRK